MPAFSSKRPRFVSGVFVSDEVPGVPSISSNCWRRAAPSGVLNELKKTSFSAAVVLGDLDVLGTGRSSDKRRFSGAEMGKCNGNSVGLTRFHSNFYSPATCCGVCSFIIIGSGSGSSGGVSVSYTSSTSSTGEMESPSKNFFNGTRFLCL